MRIPTVKIKADTKLGYMIINESRFDKRIHKLYEEKPAPPSETPAEGEKSKRGGSKKDKDNSGADKAESPFS